MTAKTPTERVGKMPDRVKTPLTPAQRVARAQTALVARGGRRIPSGYLQPDAAQALESLVQAGYAASPVAAISAALLDAQKRHSAPL